jgi:hypothetical protein
MPPQWVDSCPAAKHRKPTSAQPQSQPSKPARRYEVTVAGRAVEGVRACRSQAPHPIVALPFAPFFDIDAFCQQPQAKCHPSE